MEKIIQKPKHGFLLGKFYPPHNGHLHLIETAKSNCDHLTVLLGSLTSEMIHGSLRLRWLKEIFPNIQFAHLDEDVPQEPKDHPDFWNIWIGWIKKLVPEPIDIVFSSENYGDELAERLNAVHHPVDIDRNKFPTSGTKIRNSPIENWDYIPNKIKPHFIKKIVITGPESTGKTTLAEKLAIYFNTTWVHEYARELIDKKGMPVLTNDIPFIINGQIELEERLSKIANRVLICDTEIIVTKIYSEHYFGECPEWIKELSYKKKYDHHILMDIDIPWVDDPQRDRSDKREEMFNLFKKEYDDRHLPYSIIRGNFEERFQRAIEVINEVLKQPIKNVY